MDKNMHIHIARTNVLNRKLTYASVCLGFLLCFFSLASFPAPAGAENVLSANFSEDVTIGVAPLGVHFYDTSLGVATSWLWDFGDGTTSSEQSPLHTFTSPGVYSVSLVVSDGATSSGKTKSDLITVTYPISTALVADFAADQTTGTAPLAVQFNDISVGNPTSWSWNFGDSNTSSEQHPAHSYVTPGTYTVALTVSDGGAPVTKTVTGMITVSAFSVTRNIFQEGFEHAATGPNSIAALGWTAINNDGDADAYGPITWAVGYDDTETYAHSGVKSVVALWNNSTQNDDWLLLPPVSIPAGYKAIYSFWARAITANYFEDFNLKLSISGRELSDFTTTVAEVRSQNASWQRFAYDLSEYSGQTLNLAVQYVSENLAPSGLLLDDVSVTLIPSGFEGGWGGATAISPEPLAKVQFVNDSTGWAVGGNGTILKSVNGGVTWLSQTLPVEFPATESLYGCSFVDANHGWAIGGSATSARILHTDDGGATWSVQTSASQSRPTAIFFVDRYNGWICGENGTIQRTTDGGAHWALQETSITEQLVDIHFVDDNIGWAAGGKDGEVRQILHTENGGSSWTLQATGLSTSTVAFGHMDFIDAETGWLVGAEGVILHTIDGGATWQQQTSNTTAELTSVDFVDANYGSVVGANGLVLSTVNGGATWQEQASGTTVDLASLVLLDSTTGWAVTTSGTMLKFVAGPVAQVDSDGDGIVNPVDAFANDATEWLDTDLDGIGNNSDSDDDGDGMPDNWELTNGLAPMVAADGVTDLDGDGETNLAEYLAGQDPRANGVTISGRLVGEDDAPVAGMWVEASSTALALQAGGVSDDNGFYVLNVAPGSDYIVSVPGGGGYQFAVYAGQSLWKNGTPVDVSIGSVPGIDFVLTPGLTISGTVSGLGNGESVIIEAWSQSANSWGFTTLSGGGSGSDPFTLGGLAAGDYRLTLRSDDYQSGYVTSAGTVAGWAEGALFSGGATGVSVVATQGFAISGTISGLSAGDLFWVEAWSEATGLWNSVEVKSSGAEAQFTLTGLGAATDYQVSLSSAEYGNGFFVGAPGGVELAPGSCSTATLVDLSAGDVGGIDMVVGSAISIGGTVSGLKAGDTALLVAWSAAGEFTGSTEIIGTGSDLEYEIKGLLPAVDYKVRIDADDYRDGYYSLDGLVGINDAELVDGSTTVTGINLPLTTGNTISGSIFGLAAGEEVWIEASSEAAGSWTATSLVGSGSSVIYNLGGLPVVTDLKVTFRPANHPLEVLSDIDTGSNPIGVSCVLATGYSISGIISGAAAHEKITVSADSLVAGCRESVTVFADEAGNAPYTINRLGAASDYRLLAETTTKNIYYGDVVSRESATVVTVSNADLSGVNISLAAVTVYSLSGAVNGVDAETLVWINVWDAASGVWNGVSRRGQGLFSVDLPAGGNYKAGFYAEGFVDAYYGGLDAYAQVITVNDVAKAVAIDLSGADNALGGVAMTAGYSYGGTVYYDADGDSGADSGEELAEAMVEVVGAGVSRSCSTDSHGVFLLDGLQSAVGTTFDGVYEVAVRSSYGTYSGTVTISGADVSAVSILIEAN